MSLDQVHTLMDEYAKWRDTEAVAQEEVEDAELRAVAAEMRLREAKDKLKAVTATVDKVQAELADAIEAHTAPRVILYLTDEAR